MKPNKIIIFTALIFLLFFVWIIFVLGVSDDTANTKIEGKVYSELEKNTEVNVVLFLDEKKDQKVSQHSVKIDSFKNKKIIDSYRNSITIKVSKSELELLSKDNSVKKIILPRKVKAFLQDSVPLINVTRVWPLRVNSINITGNSETVCIIDTGINFSHPDLIGKNKTCIIDCFNKNCVENCSLSDDNGHGTHVAGIVAASGGIAGVAFNANLIGVKVLNSSGSGSGRDSDIPEAIDWCVDNRAAYNISVISMSLGTETVYEGDCGSPADSWTISINNAIVKNISVVAASGNSGNGVPRNTTHISAPACIGNVTAVSATDKSDSLSTYGHYGPRRGQILILLG
jgi:serine protease AprX